MASIPPKAGDMLHEQSKPTTTTEPHISSGSSLDHDNVEKIDRIPSYEKPIVGSNSADGDVENADAKYGTGIEEKALSTSEESFGETRRQSKLRTLWIKYRIFGHLAFWLVMTA